MPSLRPRAAAAAVLACLALLVMAGAASATVVPPPGGPILLVTSSTDPFSAYDSEILRNEGLNEFGVVDVSGLTAAQLTGHDSVVLARVSLTQAQVDTLTTWVQAGGNLIAMQPDKKLAGLLGLTDADDTVENGNLLIDTTKAPGQGLTSSLLQFHSAADVYTLNGARAVATLSPGSHPAVSVNSVGSGHAAAFAYDLARSVVYTRQGNPSWATQNRDKFAYLPNPDPVIRSNDLFFGPDPDDPQNDWVDLNRVAIPQADEQQRLLANMITQYSVTPTPRFWYLPDGNKAAAALTGDDHGGGGTSEVFEHLLSLGPNECRPEHEGDQISQTVLDSWTCPRGTSYFWPDGPDPSNTGTYEPPINDHEASNWTKYGFEFADHPKIEQDAGCVDYTPTTLNATLDTELGIFHAKYPSVPGPKTIRTHCIVWSDWASQPKADLARGIRLNADYYYFQPEWTQNRPGLFTGSGMPMRFADCDGSLIDVYQAATYAADDATTPRDKEDNANTEVPKMTEALIDSALGANGYYGAFTVQVHTDVHDHIPGRNAIIDYAMAHGVPLVSEAQLLRWLDGRNASSFEDIEYTADGTLTFKVNQAAGAAGLQAMIPAQGLTALKHGGAAMAIQTQTIKGIGYAILPDASGSYEAKYSSRPGAAHVASSFTGALPAGTGGSGGCEDAGDPGTNPAPGANPGGGNPGGANNPGGGNSPGETGTAVAEAGTVKGASSKPKKLPPFATASAKRFRPGSKRAFVVTVRLSKAGRLVLILRDKHGKVVRTIRMPGHKAGTVRVRWDGKDRRGHYVGAGTYRYTLSAVGTGYVRTARGSVAVLTAR